jgi:hypothetical protein
MKPSPGGIYSVLFLALGLFPIPGLAQDRSTGSTRDEGAQPPVFGPFYEQNTDMDRADLQWDAVDAEVLRLDKLVSLTTDQQAKAARIFAVQMHGATGVVGSIDGPIQVASDQIRAILTPAQIQILDRTFSGGDANARWAKGIANRVAKWAGLSEDQFEKAHAIYLQEAADLDALSPSTDANERSAIKRDATATVRELLTPEQQKKFDENPTGIACIDEMHFVESLLRSSDKIAGTFGTIKALAPSTWRTHLDSQGNAIEGTLVYNVEGSLKSEKIVIAWKRSAETAPIEILKVEAATGASIAI